MSALEAFFTVPTQIEDLTLTGVSSLRVEWLHWV